MSELMKCPSCYKIIDSREFIFARFDFKCTGCGQAKLSDFLVVPKNAKKRQTRR